VIRFDAYTKTDLVFGFTGNLLGKNILKRLLKFSGKEICIWSKKERLCH
jgi:hypothetical protein